jgi:hypothetical protein
MRRFTLILDSEGEAALEKLYRKAIEAALATDKVQRPPSETALIIALILDASEAAR